MKRFAPLLAAVMLTLFATSAPAATGSVDLAWQLPDFACTVGVVPCDNLPLTGINALTGVEVYLSTSPIADDSTASPTVSLTADQTTATATLGVNNGDTIYARIKVRNQFGPSDFSAQVSKPVMIATKPGVPTNVTITITIS